jgi:hypothetical protein
LAQNVDTWPLWSILPTIYECICANILALKKVQITKKIHTKLSHEKAALKMLVKLTPGFNFINILHAAFAPTVLRQ